MSSTGGLSPKAQAVIFTIALILSAIGGVSAATATDYGLPKIAGLVFLFAGFIGAALIKAYGLNQQSLANLRAKLAKPALS